MDSSGLVWSKIQTFLIEGSSNSFANFIEEWYSSRFAENYRLDKRWLIFSVSQLVGKQQERPKPIICSHLGTAIQNTNSKIPISKYQFKIPNPKYQIQNTKDQNTKYQIPIPKYQRPKYKNTNSKIPKTNIPKTKIPNINSKIPNTKIPIQKYQIPIQKYQIPNTKHQNTNSKIPNTKY